MQLDLFSFMSQVTDAADGFAGYHQLYSSVTEVDRGAGRFTARVTVAQLPRLVVFDRSLAGMRHTRNQRRVWRDGFDHINMQLLLDGRMHGGPLGEERLVQPGEIIFFDMTRPQRTIIDETRMIALSLPREMLEQHMALPRALHGAILPAAKAGLLSGFIRVLVGQARGEQAGILPPTDNDHASTAVGALAAGALSGLSDQATDQAIERRLREDHVARFRAERIMDHMARHLADPELNAGNAATALGLSRSTVNRCMAEAGGFGAVLLRMRLDKLRSALRRSDTDLPVGAIAHRLGFSSASHASRSFHARFGLPPRQWRDQQAQRPYGDKGAPGTLDYVFQELT